MTVNKLSDLLPISDDNAKPHAYEIFGLPIGESNPDTIGRAVKATISKVKAAKSQTEPTLWKQIAGIVQTARVTLADPEKKSRLDAKLGLASTPEAKPVASKPVASKPVDPLAALLPPVNPMQPVVRQEPSPPLQEHLKKEQAKNPDPASDQPIGANAMPPGLFSTPSVNTNDNSVTRNSDSHTVPVPPAQIPEPPAVEIPTIAQPTIRDTPRRTTRRRKSIFVPLVMSVITLALVAMVGLLAYALFFRQETIAISSSDRSVRIATNKNSPNQPGTRQPVVSKPKANPKKRARVPAKSQFPMGDGSQVDSDMNSTSNKMETDEPEPKVVDPMMTVSLPPPPTQTQTPTETMPAVSTTESDTEVVAKLAELRAAIRKGDWAGMGAIAEATNQMKLRPKQQADADGLLSVADLATYYRKGIEQAVAELQAGQDFEVTNGFRVVVVGKTDQTLTVRYNTKMPEFTFDTLPLSLAHRLATFQIPAGPSGDAAKAVYQAVTPKSTPGHRTQAITWLGDIDQPIEGADRDTLVQTLQSIFDDN